ncbi:MAG: hypothetical protein ACLQGU_19720 [bacterium]
MEEEKIKKMSEEAEGFLACGDTDNYYRVVMELNKLQQLQKKEGNDGNRKA